MLKIAVPHKGTLADATAQMLSEAGYRQRHDRRDLVTTDLANGVEFFYLRPRDIAVYVGEGTLDIGVTGRDLVLDSRAPVTERLSAGLRASAVLLRGARSGGIETVEELDGRRVATSYAGLLEDYFKERSIDAQVVRLDGAVETAVRLGVADAIADVVETGTTLRQAGLEIFGEPILTSEAVLVTRRAWRPEPASRRVHAPAPGRPGRAQLRDDGLRHPGRAGRGRRARSRRASSRRRCRRCIARAGSPCARWCRTTTRTR